MSYIDTCIIIAYGFNEERNHDQAEKLVQKGRAFGSFYASPFSLVELFCVLSRKNRSYSLPSWIEKLSDEKTKLEATVIYLLKLLDAKIPSDNPLLKDWNNFKLFHIFLETMQIAQRIKLAGTADTLHIAYIKKFKDEGLVKYFMTMDPGLSCKKDEIERTTEIKLL